jgi:hypothetical protein
MKSMAAESSFVVAKPVVPYQPPLRERSASQARTALGEALVHLAPSHSKSECVVAEFL